MDKKTDKKTEQNIELVDIEDLRTAFGGEDLTVETETSLVNGPTVMCSGWN